jgi:hypothetical protein
MLLDTARLTGAHTAILPVPAVVALIFGNIRRGWLIIGAIDATLILLGAAAALWGFLGHPPVLRPVLLGFDAAGLAVFSAAQLILQVRPGLRRNPR